MQWDYLYTISACYQEFVVCAPASGQAEMKLIFVINMMIKYFMKLISLRKLCEIWLNTPYFCSECLTLHLIIIGII